MRSTYATQSKPLKYRFSMPSQSNRQYRWHKRIGNPLADGPSETSNSEVVPIAVCTSYSALKSAVRNFATAPAQAGLRLRSTWH